MEKSQCLLPCDIDKKLPDGAEILMYLSDNNLTLECGKSKFTLPTLPFDDFPVMTDISEKNFRWVLKIWKIWLIIQSLQSL